MDQDRDFRDNRRRDSSSNSRDRSRGYNRTTEITANHFNYESRGVTK